MFRHIGFFFVENTTQSDCIEWRARQLKYGHYNFTQLSAARGMCVYAPLCHHATFAYGERRARNGAFGAWHEWRAWCGKKGVFATNTCCVSTMSTFTVVYTCTRDHALSPPRALRLDDNCCSKSHLLDLQLPFYALHCARIYIDTLVALPLPLSTVLRFLMYTQHDTARQAHAIKYEAKRNDAPAERERERRCDNLPAFLRWKVRCVCTCVGEYAYDHTQNIYA